MSTDHTPDPAAPRTEIDRNTDLPALREQAAHYRIISEMATDYVCKLNVTPSGTISLDFVSDAYYSITGRTRDDIATIESWSKIIHPDDIGKVMGHLHKMIAKAQSAELECRSYLNDRTLRWINIIAKSIRDEKENRVTEILCAIKDISERKQFEQIQSIQHEIILELNSCTDLRDGLKKTLETVLRMDCLDCGGVYLANAQDGSLRMVAHQGLSLHFIENASYYAGDSLRVRVVSTGEARYGTYSDLHPHADATLNKEGLRATAIIPVMCQGELIAVFNLASHTHDAIPNHVRSGLETIAFQIGGSLLRLRTAAALQESEEIFKQFMDNSPIFLFFKDDKIRPIRLSRNYETLLGRPLHELLGKSMDELFPSDLAKSMVADDIRILNEGKQITVEEEFNGRIFSTIKFPIHIQGKPRYLAGYTIDITEKQKMLESIQRADKLDALGILAGGIAHDFNNLLAGIFGFLDMARSSGTADPAVAECLDDAMMVFNRARDLTQQLLTFSKGGVPVRKTSQLGPIIQECAKFALSGSKIISEITIDPDLHPCDIDENQICQVIDNIIINAQQAMPMGGRLIIIAANRILCEGEHPALRGGQYVKVSLTDTGTGIPKTLLKRIFDPFFTTKQKGSGLGLATSHSIMQKHEGYIDVVSELDKGTTFHLYLPASPKQPEVERSQMNSKHHGSGCVLILDDEDFIRKLCRDMFTSMGYTVVEAKDGEEAQRICIDIKSRGESPACAILDLTIPGGRGGKEVIVELRKIFPDTPIFASSGYSDDPVMAHPQTYLFTDSIRKPYRRAEMAAMLNRHLS